MHHRGNMDFWDPTWINALAAARPVIIFDNSGVGRSTGEVPETFQGWADGVISFLNALGLRQIDLLGYSMGGATIQMVALTVPHIIRKLILAGTTASAPSSSLPTGIIWPREVAPKEPYKFLLTAVSLEEVKNAFAQAWFYADQVGKDAVNAYWSRLSERKVAGEPLHLDLLHREGTQHQRNAMAAWNAPNPLNSFDRLGELKMPVLVINGDNDVLIPTSRSWELSSRISNAQLIIYPHAGHGFLYQYAELVGSHVNAFLDREDFATNNAVAKL